MNKVRSLLCLAMLAVVAVSASALADGFITNDYQNSVRLSVGAAFHFGAR